MQSVDGRQLPTVARDALLEHFGAPREEIDLPIELYAPRACFVTLTESGRLRGCVGATEPSGPLVAAVRSAALDAALRDPRFTPVTLQELPGLAFEVSVLSSLEPIPARSREELAAALRPGVDGVAVGSGARRATFLPHLWRQFDARRRFIDALLQKAGFDGELEAGTWPPGLEAWRYEARTWREY